jgi:tubulin-like protein CetZ
MKLMVIGFGQCGSRIADEFARLGRRARSWRGAEIITRAIAVDTDNAALSALSTIKPHHEQRIVIGETKTRGHGVGKRSELGAEIAKEEGFKLIDAIRQTKRFSETDAFLLIAGAAGGTGSGAISVMARLIKERYADRPVYSMIILPFEHEEQIEPRNVHNSAGCLKSVYAATDAVFLIDNQRYIRKGLSLGGNIDKINRLIVEPFLGLLCAGEEKNRTRIGVTMLDAGDIEQTLSGWTAIGYGRSLLHLITFPWDKSRHFKKKSHEIQKGIKAMDEAITELSVQCNTKDAARALYLLSAPKEEMYVDLVKNLGDHLRSLSPEATTRYGDYPVNKGLTDVTLVLSAIKEIEKVTSYYVRSADITEKTMLKQVDTNAVETIKQTPMESPAPVPGQSPT